MTFPGEVHSKLRICFLLTDKNIPAIHDPWKESENDMPAVHPKLQTKVPLLS